MNKIISDNNFQSVNERFSDYLIKRMDLELVDALRQNLSQEDVILLLSASPDQYISIIGHKIGTKAKGSYFNNKNNFVHMYKLGKIDYLNINFPPEQYLYHYAISDSNSDLSMLKMFDKYKLHEYKVK